LRHSFPLFQSHLDLAHRYWSELIETGDRVIDATCGRGHDTLKLCQLALSLDKGQVYAFDIQRQAIDSTSRLLEDYLPIELKSHVEIRQWCHSAFPDDILPETIKLIVYNLGYLPGGDKGWTTEAATTLQSLRQAQELLQNGGVISMTCYPGHMEGAREEEAIMAYATHLPPKKWSCCRHVWLNREAGPSLLLIQKQMF